MQFHPESILTEEGYSLLANFLRMAGLTRAAPEIATERLRRFEPANHILITIRIPALMQAGNVMPNSMQPGIEQAPPFLSGYSSRTTRK